MSSAITHFEIHADDPARLVDFYQTLLGWRLEKVPGMDYWRIETSGGEGPALGGGLTYRGVPGVAGWVPFIASERLDEVLEQVKQFGGTILRNKAAIPRTAWVAIIADPGGQPWGIWQPDPQAFPTPLPDH